MLSGIATREQTERILSVVSRHLEGPYGVSLLDPPYTRMREDIGRLTQKFPGVAENGSFYNHAAAFYVYALYQAGHADEAWRLLRRMLPGPAAQDYLQRGQLPTFLPNYYRGAWRTLPRTAGRSSQLVHTGTVDWLYRILVDGLFGVRGCAQGLSIRPQLPSAWPEVEVRRRFRGAEFELRMRRETGESGIAVAVDGQRLDGDVITAIRQGGRYTVDVRIAGGGR
jgi:cellobionic acid phosphorylase